jgi:EAL domain-containing protein (putative c-di-GMP-specific phosphodiesterase class I)
MLWLSESSMGPDEHNAVREAADAFTNPTAAPILSFDLGDSRSAVIVRAVNTRRRMVGLVMLIMDTRIVAQGALKLMTPKLQRAVVQFAAMRPDHEPAAASAPTAQRPAPPPAAARAAATGVPLQVGPRTIAAQLEQIVSRGPVQTAGTSNPAMSARPASYVSHVSPGRPAAPARAALTALATAPEISEQQRPQKDIPLKIDRLNAAIRKSPITLHVQRLVPLSKGSQMKRYEVLLRSGAEDAPNSAPQAMLKAAVENGLGSMIDRRVFAELVGWLIRHPDIWQSGEVMFSVNLTTTALHDEHFIKFIELCLAKASLPRETIAFEVDAATALTLADKISGVAIALHRLGCPLVLDDFALRTECFELLRLPGVRYVKLASEITRKMRTDKVSQAAITAVVQMARVLGMHTVAKRTDSAADHEWLTALGVDFVQSNAVSPSAPIDSLLNGAGDSN